MCPSQLHMGFCQLIPPFSLQYLVQTRLARIWTPCRIDIGSLVTDSAGVLDNMSSYFSVVFVLYLMDFVNAEKLS